MIFKIMNHSEIVDGVANINKYDDMRYLEVVGWPSFIFFISFILINLKINIAASFIKISLSFLF